LTVGGDVHSLGDVAQRHGDGLKEVVVGNQDGLGGLQRDTLQRGETGVLNVQRLEHLHALGKVKALKVGQSVPVDGSNVDQRREVDGGETSQPVQVEFTTNDSQLRGGQLSDGRVLDEEVTSDARDSRKVNVIDSVGVNGDAALEG
jgi:hypothetical protein